MQANTHIHQINIKNLFKREKCGGKAQNSLKEAEEEANDYSGYVVNYGVSDKPYDEIAKCYKVSKYKQLSPQ